MQYLRNTNRNPYFNLALEEYYLSNATDDMFILWQNDPSVILGKNQNAYTETNLDVLREKKIHLARRITGGGAVYHDLGNLNYTFIIEESKNIFDNSIALILNMLQSFQINAKAEGRNDITLNGKKISGTAQILRDGKRMIHGTLMYDVDISILSDVLTPPQIKLNKRGIESVKARVGNIANEVEKAICIEEFIEKVDTFIHKEWNINEIQLTDEEAKKALEIAEKFQSKEWIYGKEKELYFSKIVNNREISIALEADNNKIKSIFFQGDFMDEVDIRKLEIDLQGTRINLENLKQVFIQHAYFKYLKDFDIEEICKLILENNLGGNKG